MVNCFDEWPFVFLTLQSYDDMTGRCPRRASKGVKWVCMGLKGDLLGKKRPATGELPTCIDVLIID